MSYVQIFVFKTHHKTGETSEMAAFTSDDISSTVVISYIAAC